jgi:hypothetical protein
MSISTLPLSYCTNVHPGRTTADVLGGLTGCTALVRERLGAPIAAGLWFAQPVVRELMQTVELQSRLQETLADNELCCYTLNAFPYGDFHGERVKEQVYVPDWSSSDRLEYTLNCAVILTDLLPDGTEGSISTVPLGCKQLATARDFVDRCIANLLLFVRRLDDLHDETGRVIRLAIEPEPMCTLETTAETIAFFRQLYARAADADLLTQAMRHVGVCYDVCHQSVEFENVADSIAALQRADVRINKVHITCALRLESPARNAEGRAVLAQYVEPRYLHQTFAKIPDGRIVHQFDLDAALCGSPPPDFREADEWRVHFHVPVNAEELGPLKTTRDDLKRALAAVAKLEYAPHLEVETYTWGVLPGRAKPDLVDGLTAELTATRALLAEIAPATGFR